MQRHILWEFSTRMGCSVEEARELLDKVHTLTRQERNASAHFSDNGVSTTIADAAACGAKIAAFACVGGYALIAAKAVNPSVPSRSVRGRPLHVIDYEEIAGGLGQLEL
jgi:hypothetical protein